MWVGVGVGVGRLRNALIKKKSFSFFWHVCKEKTDFSDRRDILVLKVKGKNSSVREKNRILETGYGYGKC